MTKQEILNYLNQYRNAGNHIHREAMDAAIEAFEKQISGFAQMDNEKIVLDACCGSKMFWFDKNNPEVEFCDIRKVDNEVIWRSKDGKSERTITVNPTTVADFRKLPFADNTFYHVVFDPPHLTKVGESAWLAKKYGKLSENWKDDIKKGFSECMRVLKPYGTLIFKWSEVDIKVSKILKVVGHVPLYGHKSGKRMQTHWVCFVKGI